MTWRALAAAAALGLVATACGDDGRTAVGDRYVWVEQKIDQRRPVDSLRLAVVFPAPARSGLPSVMVGRERTWSVQAIDDEGGFVTDVVPFDRGYLAVGAVGAQTLPEDLIDATVLRSAMWIGDEQGRWTRVDLPAPADGPSWLIGVERERGFVAIGRTVADEGDVFALRADIDGRVWTAATVAGGPGLQLAGVVVSNAERTVVAGYGTTWTSVGDGPWVEAPEPALGEEHLPQVGAVTRDSALFVAAGPSRRDVRGDVVVAQLDGPARPPVEALDSAFVLAAVGLEQDLVLITRAWGTAELLEGKKGRLRLVRVPENGPVETWPLPVRSRDVDAVTVWAPRTPAEVTFLAIRRTDGTVQLAALEMPGD